MPTTNQASAIALIVTFATWLTVHACLAYGLIRRSEFRTAGWLLLLPPTCLAAPYWGLRAGLRWHSGFWLVSLLAYGALLLRTL